MPRGGKRLGAGRPKGSSKYNEPTKMARIPASLAHEIVRVAAHGHQPVVADAKELEVALNSFEDSLKKIRSLEQDHERAEAMQEIQEGLYQLRKVLGLNTQASIAQPQQAISFEPLHNYSKQHILSLNRDLLSTRGSLGKGLISKGVCLESSNLFSVLAIEKLHHELGFVQEVKGTKRIRMTKTILRIKRVNDKLFKVTQVIHRHRLVYE